MGITGDTLTILCLVAGSALSTGLASLNTSGSTRTALRWATAALIVTCAIIVVTAGQVDWGALVPFVFAAVPGLTVAVVIAVIRSNRIDAGDHADDASRASSKPTVRTAREKVEAAGASAWSPDIEIQELANHIRRSAWRPRYGPLTDKALATEIHRALYRGQLTAWGRTHPESEEFQIATGPWNWADLDRLDGYAFLRNAQVPIHGLRFARGEANACWPVYD